MLRKVSMTPMKATKRKAWVMSPTYGYAEHRPNEAITESIKFQIATYQRNTHRRISNAVSTSL